MQLVGYADRASVQPGAEIGFMVSAEAQRYHASIVRLIHGDTNPAGPGFKALAVPSAIEGTHRGQVQPVHPGSWVHVPFTAGLELPGSFTVQMWICPTTPDKPQQTLLATTADDGTAVELGLDSGRVTLRRRDRAGGTSAISVAQPVVRCTWYVVAATYDHGDATASLTLQPLASIAAELADAAAGPLQPAGDEPSEPGRTGVTIAARPSPAGGQVAERFYNGKIEAPRLYDRALSPRELAALAADADPTTVDGLVAAWDFAADIATDRVTDVAGGHHGRTRQRPTRGVTGHRWDGSVEGWPHAPEHYGAIHFHDDDLDDAGWQRSIAWTVPADTPSGVYALRLQGGADTDHIPFVVRPPTGRPTARIALLWPTFSHLAYANEHMLGTPQQRADFARAGADLDQLPYPTPADEYVLAHRLNSCYDTHTDGSGVCYASRLRPLLNMRPDYRMASLDAGRGSPHQLGADLHLVDWLFEHGYDVDVVTDDDLHHEGHALVDPYRVVLTGTHHEYWSAAMLDAVSAHLDGGGRMLSLTGNAYYWVTALDPDGGHTIEIRRRGPGSRTWDAAPGEGYLATTGEPGGLWRYRARSPQQLVGVGFTAQGIGSGRPYARQPDSFDPRAAWVFDGVGDDELIGDHPCLVSSYGAAGFEIDRADSDLGTPRRTLLLATATGFSDRFQHCSEEVTQSSSSEGGSVNPLVRADMVLLEYPGDGAVFSPGSITWCGCLSHNGYANTVSRVTANVLNRFLADEPVTTPC